MLMYPDNVSGEINSEMILIFRAHDACIQYKLCIRLQTVELLRKEGDVIYNLYYYNVFDVPIGVLMGGSCIPIDRQIVS